MKRLLALLLFAILPFQATYALASSYCAHESGAPWHFGHHQHQHKYAQDSGSLDDRSDGSGTSFGQHADCASCHLGVIGLVVAGFDPLIHELAEQVDSNELQSADSLPPPRPERPNWSAAV